MTDIITPIKIQTINNEQIMIAENNNNNLRRIHNYLVCKTIGSGMFEVKMIVDPVKKAKFAAKVCKNKLN